MPRELENLRIVANNRSRPLHTHIPYTALHIVSNMKTTGLQSSVPTSMINK